MAATQFDRAAALLSVQRALLGEVVPGLVAVGVDLKTDALLLTFYLDHDNPPDADWVSTIGAEVAADLPRDVRYDEAEIVVRSKSDLGTHGAWAFMKK